VQGDSGIQRDGQFATWRALGNLGEVSERFGSNNRRRNLLKGLRSALLALQKACCETIYLNGSFITSKENPGDFDGCWDIGSVSLELLDPVLMNFSNKQAEQKKKFGGELFPNLPDDSPAFLDLFQTDKISGEAKGIVAIDLRAFG
jgi:hypothetical protein